MKVLLIKLTSMGYLTHALPAITDAAKAVPDIEFHWVVDEAFAEIPLWHPRVTRVIKSAHRRWKKNKRQTWFEGELRSFYRQLNHDDYDLVIDAQTNLKSATISFLRRGPVHGCDRRTAREFPAHWAYQFKHHIPRQQHAIARQRQLFAEAIGYSLPKSAPCYDIDPSKFPLPDSNQLGFELPQRFMFFVHNASWPTKLYPEPLWQELINKASERGIAVLLPCGNDAEFQRAQRLAEGRANAYALPKLSLNHTTALLARAEAAICCDTGLAHIAAVLGLPTITLYGATDAELIGTCGKNQQHLQVQGEFSCAPCYKKVCDHTGEKLQEASCMRAITPEQVWSQLDILLAPSEGNY